jgi:hypothetical protein
MITLAMGFHTVLDLTGRPDDHEQKGTPTLLVRMSL